MQKTTKRIKKAAIQATIFNIFIALVLLGIFLSHIVPSIISIREQQAALSVNLETQERIEKEGLSFQEFKSLYRQQKEGVDPYVVNLLKSLDQEFYDVNLVNDDTTLSYSDFLIQKKEYTIEQKSSDEFRATEQRLSAILPSYSEKAWLEGVIGDFDFITYIEALLFTFNLQTEDSIGIGTIEPVVDQKSKEGNDSSDATEASIFYIPLQLKLVGQKSNILDFLHFLENVGSINIEDGKIIPYKDSVIKKPLEWEFINRTYNIYEHQIADIEYVSMKDYIDSSSQPVNADTVSFIKSTQWREKFEIEIKARFYVSGLPDYKVESFINQILSEFNGLKKEILSSRADNKKLSRTSKSGDVLFAINTINSLVFLLDDIEDVVGSLRKDFLKDKTKVSKVYKEALDMHEQVQKIDFLYRENQKIIDTIK